jgi:multidrug efflux pump subunit AcrA (membrane-fusion protein)
MKTAKCFLATYVLAALATPSAAAQTIELVSVVKKTPSRTVDLPGEFQPFLNVALYARVPGYVENVVVDRGSVVKQGDLLVELSAPEMKAQLAAADSKVQAAEADRLQAEGKLASLEATISSMQATLKGAQATYDRLKKASETPGVVAGNELDVAQQSTESQRAAIQAEQANIKAQRSSIEALSSKKHAAEAELRTLQELESYLKVLAPFDGIVSERNVHPGALVGPSSATSLLVLQQVSRLRLVVAVPEEHVGGLMRGVNVSFAVPAYPTRTFSGTVARVSPSLEVKTRTKPVELDVVNKDQSLSPGMYSTVHWPVRGTESAIFVPKTAVVTTTERTFVVRDKNGRAEWVNVQKGAADGDLIRVNGGLQEGDRVVKRATDEMREGMTLKAGAR